TGRARASDNKISGAVNFFHSMMKRTDVREDIFASIVICNKAFIPGAGKVNHLQRQTMQEWQRFDQRLINSASALAATHNEQRGKIFLQSKFPPCICAIQKHQLRTNRRARDFGLGFWEKGRAFLETEHDRIHYSGRPAIGFSRNSIRFMNESSYAADPPGQHWRSGSEPAHPEHSVRLKLTIERPAE